LYEDEDNNDLLINLQVKELIAAAVGATIMMNALVAGYVHMEVFRKYFPLSYEISCVLEISQKYTLTLLV
jgi:hypothetical protein